MGGNRAREELCGWEQGKIRIMWEGTGQDKEHVHCNENSIYVFPEKELRGLVPISTFMCLGTIYTVYGGILYFMARRFEDVISSLS